MVNFRSLSFGRAFFMSANVNTVVFFNGSQKLFMGFSPSHSLMNSSATVFPFSGMCHSEFSTFSGCIALGAQRPIVIKLSRERSIRWSVCLSVCPVHCGKTADRIWMPFGVVGRMGFRDERWWVWRSLRRKWYFWGRIWGAPL